MLDLQARVHLHEVERAILGDELDGAGADIADRARGGAGRLAHRAAPVGVHARRRRLLDHLLMAPLDRAVALEQRDHIAVRVGEHLDLDVPRARQVAFDQHAIVAERRLRLAARERERRVEILGALDDPHALAAAAGRGLDQHRIADPRRRRAQHVGVLIVAVIAGHQRHAGAFHQRLGRGLRPHRADRRRRRADEHDARVRAGFGEVRVLAEEAVAGMDRLRRRSRARRRGCARSTDSCRAPAPARSAPTSSARATCSAPASASE